RYTVSKKMDFWSNDRSAKKCFEFCLYHIKTIKTIRREVEFAISKIANFLLRQYKKRLPEIKLFATVRREGEKSKKKAVDFLSR
ncbi:MAG: hypothetical protein K2O08_05195, partial [Clostridia bacterium]|nr:hypothetical protein [Clostridia bacterium]